MNMDRDGRGKITCITKNDSSPLKKKKRERSNFSPISLKCGSEEARYFFEVT